MMFTAVMSNSASVSEETSISSGSRILQDFGGLNPMFQNFISSDQEPQKPKKKRNLPGNPDPDAEVIALSPRTLMATNRFICEICNKGFQRDQNLQLHRRGHNLPWKLKQRNSNDEKKKKKKAYVCPEATCVHHHPSRALGDLTGIKKHYCRKHGEKKWKCDKCSKIYAVQSDWKAHSKICGTKEYRCDCGTLFSRKDSFISHRAFCDALAEESARLSAASNPILAPNTTQTFHSNHPPPPPPPSLFPFSSDHLHFSCPWQPPSRNPNPSPHAHVMVKQEGSYIPFSPSPLYMERDLMMTPSFFLPPLSATALLQRAAAGVGPSMAHHEWQKSNDDGFMTRDFLGLTADQCGNADGRKVEELQPFTGEFPSAYDRDRSLLKHQGFGFNDTCPESWGKYY